MQVTLALIIEQTHGINKFFDITWKIPGNTDMLFYNNIARKRDIKILSNYKLNICVDIYCIDLCVTRLGIFVVSQ